MRVLVVGGGIIGTTAAVRLKIRYPEAEVNCESQVKSSADLSYIELTRANSS